jgi:putative DNA primase/helicase
MTVELRSGTTRPARPEDYITKIAAVAPASAGTACPLWAAFLDRVTDHSVELQGFLQRFIGYCLTGSTIEHVLVFLYGTGANGKSVFVNTVVGIFKDYATIAPMDLFLATGADRHPTEIAKLVGARLVVAQELDAGRRWNEARIKSLTSSDKLTARFMHRNFFDFIPKFKLLIVGNHKPALRNIDEAMRRRFLLVPFTVQIPEGERDPQLEEKLKSEWPAILRWMIDGCLEWQRGGLAVPDIVRLASKDYFDEQDAIAEWIAECCETDQNNPDLWDMVGTLFGGWQEWTKKAGGDPGLKNDFSAALKKKGYQHSKTGKRGRHFVGIRLKYQATGGGAY